MSKKNKDTEEELNEETEEVEEKKDNVLTKKVTPRFMTTIYVVIIAFCVALISVLTVLVVLRVSKNAQLKAEADAIIEKYNIEATKHDNLTDPDYAEIYFDDGYVYIPSEDIIIEYQP